MAGQHSDALRKALRSATDEDSGSDLHKRAKTRRRCKRCS